MTRKIMLLNKVGKVVAEVTGGYAIEQIDSGKFSLLEWQDKRYIYDDRLRMDDHLFFSEIGGKLRLVPRDVTEREPS